MTDKNPDLLVAVKQLRALSKALYQGDAPALAQGAARWDALIRVPRGLQYLAEVIAQEQVAQVKGDPNAASLKANPFPALWVKGLVFMCIVLVIGWVLYRYGSVEGGWFGLRLVGAFLMFSSPLGLILGRSRAVCPGCAQVSSDFADQSLVTEEAVLPLHSCERCGKTFFRYRGTMLFERHQRPELLFPQELASKAQDQPIQWLQDRKQLTQILNGAKA
ncbi:MAG: hypothetical protein RRB13_09920 [bacterium]|nr:hypothetical protein [bacterium]